MADEDLFQNRLREPFTEVTRRTRRNFLAASVVGIVIIKVGLIPTKINAFGIEFTQSNQNALLNLIALVISYFGIAFFIYILSELTAWQIAFRSQELRRIQGKEKLKIKYEDHDIMHWFRSRYRLTTSIAMPMFILRILFEVGVPIAVGIYTVSAILSAEPSALIESNTTIKSTPKNDATDSKS